MYPRTVRDRCQALLVVAAVAVSASGGCSGGSSVAQTDASTPSNGGNGGQQEVPTADAGPGPMELVDASHGALDAGRSSDDAGRSSPDRAAAAEDGGTDSDTITGPKFEVPKAAGCVTDVTAGVHDFTCDTTIDTVSVPEACTKRSCGVIVDVHGGMMSSQMQDKNTNLRALGVQHGYIVIQPNALQNEMLLNQRLYVADMEATPADDTRVMDILTQVIDVFHADKKRIHMTGFSEGGFMSWRWFCAHSDLLASVAPGAAAWNCGVLANIGLTPPEVGCELSGSSVPAHNLPVLYLQGMQDGLIDPECADGWVRTHAFSALKLGSGETLAGDPNFKSAQYVRTRYLDPAGVPFEYIQHQYTSDSSFLGVPIVGHCYPGSTDLTVTPPEQTVIQPDQLMSFGCKDKCDFNWGEEVIKFFMAHPKP